MSGYGLSQTGQYLFRLLLSPTFAIAIWISPSAWCDNYQYDADIPRLGQGFSKLTPTEGFQSCFDPAKISEAPGPAVATAFNLETQLIDNRKQMVHCEFSSVYAAGAAIPKCNGSGLWLWRRNHCSFRCAFRR